MAKKKKATKKGGGRRKSQWGKGIRPVEAFAPGLASACQVVVDKLL